MIYQSAKIKINHIRGHLIQTVCQAPFQARKYGSEWDKSLCSHRADVDILTQNDALKKKKGKETEGGAHFNLQGGGSRKTVIGAKTQMYYINKP